MKIERFSRKGFTLIEILLATVLLTMAGALLFGAFLSARRWTSASVDTVPANLARERLEELGMFVRFDTWNDFTKNPLAGGTSTEPPPPLNVGGVDYTRTTVTTPVTGRNYRKVQVTVTP